MDAILGGSSYSAKKLSKDPYPNIRPGGYQVKGVELESADYSIRQDVHIQNSPSTPEHLKKFRKSHVNQPGAIQKHPGVADDIQKYPADYSYGKSTHGSEHVGDVLKAQHLTGMADKFNNIKEGKYASNVREPLGSGFSREYNWPDQAENGSVKFGVPSQGLNNAKDILYAQGGANSDDLATQQMYRKTHGNFQPGEQKQRDYNWNFDPADHRFGYNEQRVLNGAANALHMERNIEQFPKTIIVKKTIEDHKNVASDLLGQSKNLGQGQADRGDEFVHGIRNVQGSDPWNAARCIHGEPQANQVVPDKDLGNATKPNCRNVVRREEDRDRSFGCPTIRNDIPFKEFKSVADYQNYGDEPEAVDLLFPSNYSELGIEEQDFRRPRNRDQIRLLFSKAGFQYKIGKFNAVYNRAIELGQSVDDRVSVRDFQFALSQMHNIQ